MESIPEWAVPVLQFGLLLILLRRNLHRKGQFPFFATYTAYSLVASALRESVLRHPILYFVSYWSTEAIFAPLTLLALNEVFRRLFAPDFEDHRWFRFLLPGAALIIGLLCLLVLLRHPPGGHFMNIAVAIYAFDLGINIVEAGILLLFWLLAKLLLAPKSRYDFGILTGFGVSASVTIVADVARFYFGSGYEAWFRYGPAFGFMAAILIWLAAFFPRPRTQARPGSLTAGKHNAMDQPEEKSAANGRELTRMRIGPSPVN